MDIYSKKQKWKFTLLGFAIIIGISSLFVTNQLVKQLKNEERKKIELWAQATKHLLSITGEGDYSLALKVITENQNRYTTSDLIREAVVDKLNKIKEDAKRKK